jgi:hypothetical protein
MLAAHLSVQIHKTRNIKNQLAKSRYRAVSKMSSAPKALTLSRRVPLETAHALRLY